MNLIWTSLTSSTNSQIQDYPDNTILIANSQSAGRGRYGNQWLSDLGGIYFSYKIKNPKTKLQINFWSIAVGIACHRALDLLNISTLIKWPNDIYNLKHQKLAGILLERVLKSDELIIGIGLNYQNQNLPLEFARLETKIDKLSIVNLIIQNINQVFNCSFDELKQYYEKYSYIQNGEIITYSKLNNPNQVFTSLVKELLESGELLVQDLSENSGSLIQLNISDIHKTRKSLNS